MSTEPASTLDLTEPESVRSVDAALEASGQRSSVRNRVGRAGKSFAKFFHASLVWSVGTSFAIFLFTAIQGVFLARILGPLARGEYGTAVFYTQTLTYLGLLGTQLSIARRAARGEESLAQLGRASLRLGAWTGLATMVAVAGLALVALPADKSYLAPLCMTCALFLPWEHMRLSLLAVDHGSGQFTRYNIHRLVAAASYPSLLLIAWVVGVDSLNTIIVLSVLVPVVPLALRIFSEPYSLLGPALPPSRTLVKEGLPYAVAQMAADLVNRLDVFLILWLASLSVQGYYAAAVPAASLLVIAPNTMALFAFNAGARHDNALRTARLAAVGSAVLAFQLFSGLAFAAILAPLVTIVYGPAFEGTVPFALALLPAFAVNGCAMVAEAYLQGRGRSTVGVPARLFGAVVMLLFVWCGWSTWHEMSIPLAAIAGQSANALWILAALVSDARATRTTSPRGRISS
ncbi:MAG TPA: hypothetical protein VHV08_15530 [Pirellulales bacterium]|nr:hypothetical protein [Pirellulales bacterium]